MEDKEDACSCSASSSYSSFPAASFTTTNQRMEAKDIKAVAERTSPSIKGQEHGTKPSSLLPAANCAEFHPFQKRFVSTIEQNTFSGTLNSDSCASQDLMITIESKMEFDIS